MAMKRLRAAAAAAAGALIIAAGAGLLLSRHAPPTQQQVAAWRAQSERAFDLSYRDSAAGKLSQNRTPCAACHVSTNGLLVDKWAKLLTRATLGRAEWAAAISLTTKCGLCHVLPMPETLASANWPEVFSRMDFVINGKQLPPLPPDDRLDLLHYYLTFSPGKHPPLPPDPDPRDSPIQFRQNIFGEPKNADSRQKPIVGHVQIVDLDQDGLPDVVVSDIINSQVSWIHRANRTDWREDVLAKVPLPTHTQVVSNAATHSWDVVVAAQTKLAPSDDPVGSVVLLRNDGRMHFTTNTLVDKIGRIADVEPGDFNGDGATDFVVAEYGLINRGEVGWLEASRDNKYIYHTVIHRTGAIHVPPADLNGDGRLDFVALFAQEHEQISVFINDGHGEFQERILFKASTPSFGSSGIQLVDLDQDGDLDILYTNGDNSDLPSAIPRPYHGVQWLENKGDLNFVWHDIGRFYGAYSAVAADMNRDGRLDVVAASLFNDWEDPTRASLIWYENDGRQNFTPHGIARNPIDLISAAVGDLNGDGWPDIVASGFHSLHSPPFARTGRITLWTAKPN